MVTHMTFNNYVSYTFVRERLSADNAALVTPLLELDFFSDSVHLLCKGEK